MGSSPVAQPTVSYRRIVLTVGIVLVSMLAAAGLPFGVAFVGYAFGSALIIWLIAGKPRAIDLAWCTLGSAVVAGLNIGFLGRPPLMVDIALGYCGLGTLAVLGIKAVWAEEDEREQLKHLLMPSLAMVFMVLASQNLLAIPSLVTSKTYDVYAFVVDGSLGFQPSFLAGQFYIHHRAIFEFGQITYYGLPVAMAIVYALQLKYKLANQWHVLELLFAAGFVGYLLYNIFPAGGPIYVFTNIFPDHPLPLEALRRIQVELVPVGLKFPRNAMPSLHMTWAILLWFCCWRLPRVIRWTALAYVLVTVLDTMGSGEHYFIDLVVAVPFSVVMQGVCAGSVPFRSWRAAAVYGGAAITAAWLLVLREWPRIFLVSPALPWACIVISTVASLYIGLKSVSAEYAVEPVGKTEARSPISMADASLPS